MSDKVRKLPKREKPRPDNGDGHETGVSVHGESGQTGQTGHPTATPPAPEKTLANTDKENGNGNSGKKTSPMISEAQKNAIYNLSRRRNITVEELENLAMNTFNVPLEGLTSTDASAFIRTLQQAS